MKKLICAFAGCMLAGAPATYAATYVFTTINPTGAAPSSSGAFVSGVFGLNDNGELVVSTPEGGMIYQDGTYTPLSGGPSGYTLSPEGINDAGTIVGTATDVNGNTQEFIDSKGSYSLFSVPGNAGYSEARAVSASGVVSGIFTDNAGNLEGYTYDPATGVFNDINPPGSIDTFAQGMNGTGQLIGSGLSIGSGEYGFTYQNGTYTTFKVNGVDSAGRGINDSGMMTGHVDFPKGVIDAFVGSPSTGFQILSAPNATQTLGEAINDSGQIVGDYTDANNNSFGFLATPVVLPSGRTANGSFTFDVAVQPSNLIYIDPKVASGYQYQTGTGDPNFESVVLPIGIGNNLYSLSSCDGTALGAVAGGAAYSFGPGGTSCFDVKGIAASAGLDPSNPESFATGLTFAGEGTFTGTMTPVTTAQAAPEIDPAGAWGALTLLAGLLSLARGRGRAMPAD